MFAALGFPGEAVVEAEKAVALDVNDATAHAGLAEALVFANRPAEALEAIETAIRLDPHNPPSYLITLGAAQFGLEQFEEAAATFERAVKRNPENEIPFIYLASAYGHQGRIEDADDTIERANDLRNLVGLGELSLRDVMTYSDVLFNAQIDFARFGSKPVQELVRAGLTEIPALKWQYLVTAHRVLGGSGNSWLEVEGATQIDVSTAKSLYDRGVLFVDVGSQSMRNAGHIPGAVHLPFDRTGDPSRVRLRRTTFREIAAYNDEIVITFGYLDILDGEVAWEAAKVVAWGYSKVYHFDGGAKAWKEAGHPIETGQ
jgi:tetratricopeptide (TPR) repeat protein